MLRRIKEFACSTLQLKQAGKWEAGLTRAITAGAFEQINFLRLSEGARLIFMPHSPGIYIALMLKDYKDLESSEEECNTDDAIDLAMLTSKSS